MAVWKKGKTFYFCSIVWRIERVVVSKRLIIFVWRLFTLRMFWNTIHRKYYKIHLRGALRQGRPMESVVRLCTVPDIRQYFQYFVVWTMLSGNMVQRNFIRVTGERRLHFQRVNVDSLERNVGSIRDVYSGPVPRHLLCSLADVVIRYVLNRSGNHVNVVRSVSRDLHNIWTWPTSTMTRIWRWTQN